MTGISWPTEFTLPARQLTVLSSICSCRCAKANFLPTVITAIKPSPRTPPPPTDIYGWHWWELRSPLEAEIPTKSLERSAPRAATCCYPPSPSSQGTSGSWPTDSRGRHCPQYWPSPPPTTQARWAVPAAKPPTDDATRAPRKSSATALCPIPTPSDGRSHPAVIPTSHPWTTTTSEDLWHSPEPHLSISKTLPCPHRSPGHPLPTVSWLGTFGCHMQEPRIQMLCMFKLWSFCPRMPISTTVGLGAGWSGASCKYWRVPRDITTWQWDSYWLTRHPPPPWEDWNWKWVWCRSFCR